jgi:threonine synthase
MSLLMHLECFRCGRTYPPEPYLLGCPACTGTAASNLFCVYDYEQAARSFRKEEIAGREPTMWRYRELFPVDDDFRVSLGEGMTPLLHLPRLGRRLGLTRLYVKDESQNPTWSFKDRMAAVGVSKALELGRRVITAASSGNGGAASAAYAARGGLKSIIFTTPSFPLTMRVLMQTYGSLVLATPTIEDRWKMVRLGVEEYGWFPVQNFLVPAVGANQYAQEGCKALAYETCEQLGWRAPDAMIFPIGLGDTLTGAWRGSCELRRLDLTDRVPAMIGAEVFGALENALERGLDHTEPMPTRPTVAISSGTANSAYQSLRAVRESGGTAASAGEEEIMQMQLALAEDEGIYAEASAVVPFAIVPKLLDRGAIRRDDVVVCVSTSSGLKDPEVTRDYLPEIPLIEPTREGLTQTLATVYATTPEGEALASEVAAAMRAGRDVSSMEVS